MRRAIAALATMAALMAGAAAAHDGRGHAGEPRGLGGGHSAVDYPLAVRVLGVENRAVELGQPFFFLPDDRFKILVSPSLVGVGRATDAARDRAAAFCRQAVGRPQARIYEGSLHSRLELDSWEFDGYCR